MKVFSLKALSAMAALMGGVAFVSTPAMATHITQGFGFSSQPFTFNPNAVDPGAAPGAFDATLIDFSYRAGVSQTGSNFLEQGFAFFSTFQHPTLGSPVSAATSGLNVNYKLYAIFTGIGTTSAPVTGGVDGVFNNFAVDVFLDRGSNTTCVVGPGASATCTDPLADDVKILSGTLSPGGTPTNGGFHVFPGLVAGDFDVLFDVTSFNSSVWGGAAFAGSPVQGDFNGVNTSITGVTPPPSDFTDGKIIGSGNGSFQSVPEPTTTALLGLGLAGLGFFGKRRSKN